MNYAMELVEIRQRRDARLEQARAEAKRQLAEVAAARDAEIHRLRVEAQLSCEAIAAKVGCSKSTVFEVARPEKRSVYNRRRLDHWRARAADGRVAA